MKVKSRKRALLILDMLSEFEFEDGPAVQRAALRIAPVIERLRKRAHAAGSPVVYINDTRERWESDQQAFISRCLSSRGRGIAELLRPSAHDYFMFKPKHSGFYATPLAELLYMHEVQHIVLTGISSHQCVLLTASDAHVRNLEVTVVRDGIAAPRAAQTRHALFILEQGIRAQICSARNVRL